MRKQQRHWLGIMLFAVSMLGIVATLLGCNPEEMAEPGDNTRCRIDGFDEWSVRGHLRIAFPFGGGDPRVTEGGLDRDLHCEVLPAGKVFDPITDEVVDE